MTTVTSREPETSSSRSSKVSVPVLGVDDQIGEGDTYLVENILPPELAEVAIENLRKEVAWDVMHHRGGEVPRLVAVEGEIDSDGNYPIYRHPADESPALRPFSPTVSQIRASVERVLQHPVNHVLIQLYRTGADYISEHSDKTIDVVHGSRIVNLSLGARRTMTLRTKKDAGGQHRQGQRDEDDDGGGSGGGVRRTQRVPLPHNSLFVMGLATNARWMHSVHTDSVRSTPRTQPSTARALASPSATSAPSSRRRPASRHCHPLPPPLSLALAVAPSPPSPRLPRDCSSSAFSGRARRARHAQRRDPSCMAASRPSGSSPRLARRTTKVSLIGTTSTGRGSTSCILPLRQRAGLGLLGCMI
ncbi:hypothetical protein BJV78DRAFT_1237646, partial [Lactifluus subvellereus]